VKEGNDVTQERKKKESPARGARWIVTACLAVALGCAAAAQLVALRQVEFHLNGVSGASVAGVALENVRSYSDLGPADLARLGLAIAAHEVPLELTVQIEGRNPETNTVTAKLLAMDWTCLVDDRELVSGQLREPYSFPPGKTRDIPLHVRLDLMQAFGSRRQDLVDVALALTGRNASTHQATLRLTPSVDTALGTIRYPVPITLTISAAGAR
jgi:hypothetical protein